jgi:aryl-alcohol dehydrogenase-like predicted oxidoreductase
MELIQIGKNGPKVAAVGVGCWAWGDTLSWGYGRGYDKNDLRGGFQASIAAGQTFFDTAEIYGLGSSEKILGEFIGEHNDEVVIASKCFPYPWRFSARSLLPALKRSLRRLGVAQIQLYQVHWPFAPVKIENWMNAMADAVEAGLIKQVGVSNYNAQQTELAYKTLEKRGLHLASNQILYSLLDRGPERSGLRQLCKDLGITVIAYSPLAQGLLTGKYSAQNPMPGRRKSAVSAAGYARLQPLLDEMQRIGLAHGEKTRSQVALNWCVLKGTLPIPGAKNAGQAADNAGALGWSLTQEESAKLDELTFAL